MFDIANIIRTNVVEAHPVAALHLPQARQAGQHFKAPPVPGLIVRHFIGERRAAGRPGSYRPARY